jgi:hypothetical protein
MSLLLLPLESSALLVQYRCIPNTAGMSSRPALKGAPKYAVGFSLYVPEHPRLALEKRWQSIMHQHLLLSAGSLEG